MDRQLKQSTHNLASLSCYALDGGGLENVGVYAYRNLEHVFSGRKLYLESACDSHK